MDQEIYLRKEDWDLTFVFFCNKEFKLGCENDWKENHIRVTHTFEYNVCELRNNNKKELYSHPLTCKM